MLVQKCFVTAIFPLFVHKFLKCIQRIVAVSVLSQTVTSSSFACFRLSLLMMSFYLYKISYLLPPGLIKLNFLSFQAVDLFFNFIVSFKLKDSYVEIFQKFFEIVTGHL